MDRGVGAAARLLPEGDRKDLAIQALAGSETVCDLAARHGVSRKFVYQQRHKARAALDDAFSSTLTVSVLDARLDWFGEAAGASGQTRDEGDGNASSDGGDRVRHVALRSDGQPLADGNLGVGQVS